MNQAIDCTRVAVQHLSHAYMWGRDLKHTERLFEMEDSTFLIIKSDFFQFYLRTSDGGFHADDQKLLFENVCMIQRTVERRMCDMGGDADSDHTNKKFLSASHGLR